MEGREVETFAEAVERFGDDGRPVDFFRDLIRRAPVLGERHVARSWYNKHAHEVVIEFVQPTRAGWEDWLVENEIGDRGSTSL